MLSIISLHLITLIVFPYFLRPFHFAIFMYLTTIFYQKINNLTRSEFIFILNIILFWFISLFISMFYYKDHPISLNVLYNYFSLLLVVLSYMTVSKYCLSIKKIVNISIMVSVFISLFIIIGFFFPSFFLLKFYIADSQIIGVERLGTIVAPFGNPNINGLLIALTLSFNVFLIKKFSDSINPLKKILIIILSVILLIGLFFTFARTVFASFLVFLLFLNIKNSKFILFISLLLLIMSLFLNNIEKYVIYYETILTFYEDNSFIARYVHWNELFNIYSEKPLYSLFGFSLYKSYFIQTYGYTMLDSSLVYLLLAHGVVITTILLFYIFYMFLRKKAIFYFLIVLLISSVTIPFLTDPRSCLYIGVLLGLVNILEKHYAKSN